MLWPAPATAALLVATLVAALTAAWTPFALAHLPEPPDAQGKPTYHALRTPGFVAVVGAVSLAAGVVAFPSVASAHWPTWAALVATCVPAAVVDARTTYLPLRLTQAAWVAVGLGVAWATAATADAGVAVGALVGALLLGGFFHLVWRVSGAIGYGDVRLLVSIGAAAGSLSVGHALLSLLLGTAVGAAWAVVHRVRRGPGAFAYGPALLTGPFLALLVAAG